jgi:predicted 3-demethylubiquinone-9 3-methyltransferase (glyoxalase superfamily)
MPKITPFLWFNGNAEEAANFYVSIFKDSKIKGVERHGDAGPGPKGSVMIVNFTIEGQEFTALNGGPHYQFSEAVSFVVHCKTQEEVDHYYSKLTADGGQEIQCGWVKDKYGLAWQITPDILIELLRDKDKVKSQRVMQAMMQMRKIDIAKLKQAYDQG